jgi:hypothetical protein
MFSFAAENKFSCIVLLCQRNIKLESEICGHTLIAVISIMLRIVEHIRTEIFQ